MSVKEFGQAKPKRRITRDDWSAMAEFVDEEWQRRKGRPKRKSLELQWKEIDRQIAMEPDLSFKTAKNGQKIPHKAWMPELELPLQAQTLEVLTADARRMMLPDSGPWFKAHAELTDEFLETVSEGIAPIPEENDPPSLINQDNVDKVVEGWLSLFHRQYDFAGTLDLINAEAFKYSMGVGRGRLAKKSVFLDTARGTVRRDMEIPVLFPRSIKNTYLDDTASQMMNEGYIVGPSVIYHEKKRFVDILLAANRGSNDPDDQNGGWMPKNIGGFNPSDEGVVDILEFEGDMIVPRKTTRSLFLPNVIVTVIRNKGDSQNDKRVIRFRFRKVPNSSYILFPYHREHIDTPYATSPLMKGRPLQVAGTEAFLRLMQAAAYNTEPVMQWDRSDPYFSQHGGPKIWPGASIGSIGDLKVLQIGDPTALLNVLTVMLQWYSDVTGVNAPRLGAQTISHTTAFAKDVELTRGTVRTVDYVRSSLQGGLTKWLSMEYELARSAMGRRKDRLWIEAYGGFVDVTKKGLPENATFEVFGSGGPQEEAARIQRKLQSLQLALQMDQLGIQLGDPRQVQIGDAIKQVLRDGGWTDVESIAGTAGVPAGAEVPPAVQGAGGDGGAPNVAALQSIQGGAG